MARPVDALLRADLIKDVLEAVARLGLGNLSLRAVARARRKPAHAALPFRLSFGPRARHRSVGGRHGRIRAFDHFVFGPDNRVPAGLASGLIVIATFAGVYRLAIRVLRSPAPIHAETGALLGVCASLPGLILDGALYAFDGGRYPGLDVAASGVMCAGLLLAYAAALLATLTAGYRLAKRVVPAVGGRGTAPPWRERLLGLCGSGGLATFGAETTIRIRDQSGIDRTDAAALGRKPWAI